MWSRLTTTTFLFLIFISSLKGQDTSSKKKYGCYKDSIDYGIITSLVGEEDSIPEYIIGEIDSILLDTSILISSVSPILHEYIERQLIALNIDGKRMILTIYIHERMANYYNLCARIFYSGGGCIEDTKYLLYPYGCDIFLIWYNRDTKKVSGFQRYSTILSLGEQEMLLFDKH